MSSLLTLGFGVLLVATVVPLSFVDLRHLIIPNYLNALLAAGGIFQSVVLGHPDFVDAGLGALLGFAILCALAISFRYLRAVDGLGLGDQKFAAAAGLWIGWQNITSMLLIASVSALVFVGIRVAAAQTIDRAVRLPFGPFLALGTVACWLAVALT